jgi:outer membrane receptor protein involved in Fe transport
VTVSSPRKELSIDRVISMLALIMAVTINVGPSPASSPSPAPGVIGSTRAATGTPETLHRSAITATTLDLSSAATAGEPLDAALRALPGYDRTRANTGFSNYGLNRLSIAGAGTDRAAFIVDGVPATDPFGGQIDWAAIPLPALTRVELFTGPGSALYGSGAIGGALDVRTYDARDAAAGVTGTRAVAESGGIDDDLAALSGGRAGRFSWAAWADGTHTEFGALPPDETASNATPALTTTGSARATLRYGVGAFGVELGIADASDAQQEGRPHYDFSGDSRQVDVALNADAGSTTFALQLFARTTGLINAADSYPAKPGLPLYTQTVLANDLGAALTVIANDTRGSTLVLVQTRDGGGASVQRSPVGALEDEGTGIQDDDALALQRDYRAGPFDAIVGGRVDAYTTDAGAVKIGDAQRHDTAVSPRAAISYALGTPLVLRIYDGGGLREPFLNELVRGYRIGAISYEPNIGLVPERSRGDGVGVDWLSGTTRATFDLQQTRVVNAIDFRTLSPTLQMRSNVGATATDGTQFSLQHRAGCGRYDVTASERYARVTDDVNPVLLGRRLPYVPDRAFSLGWSGGASGILSVRMTALGTAYADDLNHQVLPAATVFDASYTQPGRRADLTFGATNATDARYLTSPDRLAPPSNLYLRLTTHASRAAKGCGSWPAS